jgi:hypothetical protein
VDDILSQGGDRGPSPWPRRLTLIAALVAVVAVVVGAVVYLVRPQHQHAPTAAHRTEVSPSPTPASSGLEVEPSAPPGPSGIIGRTLAWDPSVRLPVAGTQPVWFSPASGRSEAIGGLPAGRGGYQFTRVVGGWAVQARATSTTVCDSCAGSPTPVWFLADGAQSATGVGTANLVAPGAPTAASCWCR